MANWRYTCDIKQHFVELTEETISDSKIFSSVRDNVVAELKKAKDYETDDELWGLAEEMADTENWDQFNSVLFWIYEWADDALVWMGL